MNPKVLVGCPIYSGKEYTLKEYIDGLKALTYENFDVCLIDNSKETDFFHKLKNVSEEWNNQRKQKFFIERIVISSTEPRDRIVQTRNKLREIVLKKNYDYFLSLEADVIPPVDTIERLLSRKRDVVSGVYFNIVPLRNSLVILAYKQIGFDEKGEEQTKTLTLQELMPSRLIDDLRVVGLGCNLIKRNVLEKVKFRFDAKYEAFDDWWFCTDAIKVGYKICLDTSMLCKHNYKAWL